MDLGQISITIPDDKPRISKTDTQSNSPRHKMTTKKKRKHRERSPKKKRSHKRRKHKRKHKRRHSQDDDDGHLLQNIRNIFPTQSLYAWSCLLALCGLICSVTSFIMPWLQGITTCIINGENSPKISFKVYIYKVYETQILCFIQMGVSLLFILIIQKCASLPNNHHSKMPQLMRLLFILYLAAIYFMSLQSGSINKALTDRAHSDYESYSKHTCSDERFLINADFTIWKQLFVTSIYLTFSSGVIANFRSIFIAQSSKIC